MNRLDASVEGRARLVLEGPSIQRGGAGGGGGGSAFGDHLFEGNAFNNSNSANADLAGQLKNVHLFKELLQ